MAHPARHRDEAWKLYPRVIQRWGAEHLEGGLYPFLEVIQGLGSPLMALTKQRRTHETPGDMDSRSMRGQFFEVP